MDFPGETPGHQQGDEDSQEGGVGHQPDADWGDVEVDGVDLAVEEATGCDDSNDRETEGDSGEDGGSAVLDGDLFTEEV